MQVENKGSAALDNRGLEDSVKARSPAVVAKKKGKLRERAVTGSDPYPASIQDYPTITVVDSRKDGNVRCLLTDPPPDPREDTPRRFRLVQRMRFIRDWVSFISPRSQLAAALSTRVAALENMRDPFELNGVHLVRGNGRPFDFAPYRPLGQHSTFSGHRSRVTDGPAGGEVVRLSENALFLLWCA